MVSPAGLPGCEGGLTQSKAGLFAKLGVLLLAAKTFIVLGVAALAEFVGKLFGKKGGT